MSDAAAVGAGPGGNAGGQRTFLAVCRPRWWLRWPRRCRGQTRAGAHAERAGPPAPAPWLRPCSEFGHMSPWEGAA